MTTNYHREGELVAALSKGGCNIVIASALELVYGNAIGLDMTRHARERGPGGPRRCHRVPYRRPARAVDKNCLSVQEVPACARMGWSRMGTVADQRKQGFFNERAQDMRKTTDRALLAVASLMMLGGYAGAQQSQPNTADMTFFVTSVGPGNGGDLGGLEGADKHCQALAKAAGGGDRPWRAYLSTQAPSLSDPNFVNARDRIGAGPWQNALGVVIAKNVEDLHSSSSNLNKQTAVDEMGRPVNSRPVTPLKHDMLTGSRPDGTAFPGPPFPDMTCGNWTKSGPDGSAMLGHHDRTGPTTNPWGVSWNSSHPSLGCNLDKLRPTGGDGLFYCFAEK